MIRRILLFASLLGIPMVVLSVSLAPIAGQSRGTVTAATQKWTTPRTPDGQPDLQGVWDFKTLTPMERPSSLAGKQVLTDEEATEFAEEQNRRQNRDLVDPKKGGAGYPAESQGGVVPYNEFWYDRGTTASKRSSLIVDPDDGKIPALTKDAQARRDAGRAERTRPAQGPEDLNLGTRCISGFNAGPPMVPSAYNNNVEIEQGPGYVVVINEMIHDARIIPLDGRPHIPGSVRQRRGDSRGRWEAETLVVDTTNYLGETSFTNSGSGMHLVERFTRVDRDSLRYEATVEDANTWIRPWSFSVSMTKNSERVYEYACQEGNYGLAGILEGARAAEKRSSPR